VPSPATKNEFNAVIMNIAKEKAKYKRLADTADSCIELATQLLNTATHLKSEATTALNELGDSTGGGRKAQKLELSDLDKARLRAGITAGRRNAANV
jgi:hypothetical protein